MVGGKTCGITVSTDYNLKCVISKEQKLPIGLNSLFFIKHLIKLN